VIAFEDSGQCKAETGIAGVASTIVPPGARRPSRSAASIIERPMRSLIDPPGFLFSSLAKSRHDRCRTA